MKYLKHKNHNEILTSEKKTLFNIMLRFFTGGFCFAYNADLFYRDIFPGYDLGWSLFVVTFLVGSVGVVIGGVTSDSIVKKYGIRSRVAVLAISQVCEHGNTRNTRKNHSDKSPTLIL